MTQPILIAGGGIGGLTLALMLQQRGIDCVVLEAVPTVRPLGVGINILPHCVREFAALGLLPGLDQIGIRTRELRYANRYGQIIWQEPRGLHAGHDVPQFSIHRGHLHALLWNTVAARLGPALRSGARVVDVAQGDGGVTVTLASGERLEGAALIGADGIHSVIRAALHPEDGGVRWQGVQMWRGAVDWPLLWDGATMCIAGDETTKLVLYPIGPGERDDTRLLNWVVYSKLPDAGERPPGRQDWSRDADRADILPKVADFRLPFIDPARLIGASPGAAVYPMCDRDPLRSWTAGRVTLLGDAAHPMYPVGSNGASQAVLDARCLADLLASTTITTALAAYDADRRPQTAKIVASNRQGGPERVIDLAAMRAPDGFWDRSQILSDRELSAIVGGYAQMAGFATPQS